MFRVSVWSNNPDFKNIVMLEEEREAECMDCHTISGECWCIVRHSLNKTGDWYSNPKPTCCQKPIKQFLFGDLETAEKAYDLERILEAL